MQVVGVQRRGEGPLDPKRRLASALFIFKDGERQVFHGVHSLYRHKKHYRLTVWNGNAPEDAYSYFLAFKVRAKEVRGFYFFDPEWSYDPATWNPDPDSGLDWWDHDDPVHPNTFTPMYTIVLHPNEMPD